MCLPGHMQQQAGNVGRYNVTLRCINPLNAELNPICRLLALLGAHHILHVSRLRVNGSIVAVGMQLVLHSLSLSVCVCVCVCVCV